MSNRSCRSWLGVVALAMSINALAPTESTEPLKTTICELLAKPEQFSGKMVIFTADLINPRRMSLKDGDCERVLLVFPHDYEARPKPKFKLIEDENFKRLMNSVSVLVPPPSKRPGKITATFEGRFDSVWVLRNGRKVQRDPKSIRLAAHEVRLVLHRVSDVLVAEPPSS